MRKFGKIIGNESFYLCTFNFQPQQIWNVFMEMVPTNFNKKVFSTLDRDNDGGIGVEEFVTVSLRLASQMNTQALECHSESQAFRLSSS